jgi:hypothetical protein
MRAILLLTLQTVGLSLFGQPVADNGKWRPLVNQAGYNLGESKRFVCYGAPDGTGFRILNDSDGKEMFRGEVLNFEGWFTELNPRGVNGEYVVEVDGHGRSVPFQIGDHLIERISSKLAYDFFVDVRGNASLEGYQMDKVYGGGPSRDVGAYGLESVFESLLYASNPALFDNWKHELGEGNVPDLIKLILWHAEFAYKYHEYNGPVANRHGSLGYEGEPRMSYDYWNTLDQLAVVCAAYHSFLKPYLAEATYRKYRKVCLDLWVKYDRHKEVRYWTYSTKWVDRGFQEFNEMGNAFGQSVIRNLFMYLTELNEKDGNADQFLRWAQESADDIIQNWDFNNPRHMWWIRNAEHITPQALALFLLIAPEKAPAGTKAKLEEWSIHMKQKTNNYWKYRVHSETEWAHPATKELGGAPALGGSMFAVAHLLGDSKLRQLGWAQVDFTFGVNPVGAHLSNKSKERLDINGYWSGVEIGWPQAYGHGYGLLARVRGTLDGSPLDHHFPRASAAKQTSAEQTTDAIGKDSYSTEGWAISNRGWMATLTFSTLGSHSLKVLDARGTNEISSARRGETIVVELHAALNQKVDTKDQGWVEIRISDDQIQKLAVVETDSNSGIFRGTYTIPSSRSLQALQISYGYWGFAKRVKLNISK